jgi:Na+/H+-dicarboxylate symporter
MRKKMKLSTKVFIGFGVGIVLGLIFQGKILVLKPIGDIFLNLIKMIVVPLVFFSICTGISNIEDVNKLKRVGGKILLMYIVTTAISAFIGLGVGHLLNPGRGFVMDAVTAGNYKATEMPSFADTMVSLIPSNPVKALADGNMMQIIVFTVFLGIAITILKGQTQTVRSFFKEATEIMYKITGIVMELSPYGVCVLIACSIGQYGMKVFGPLGKFILADYLCLAIIVGVMYVLILKFMGRIRLGYFFRKIMPLWLVTASTTSSSGSLPVTMRITQDDFGVDEELAGFSLPLGATINMNAGGAYYAMAVVFASQIYGIDLSISQQLMLVLLSTLISVGSPGIPGGGIVMTIMLLTTMGLPIEIMGMIAGIYRIIDMGHTTINVTGDVVCSIAVARGEGMLDEERMRAPAKA